jgi:hypothetical protein
MKGYLHYPKGTLGLFTNRKKSLQMQYRNDELGFGLVGEGVLP